MHSFRLISPCLLMFCFSLSICCSQSPRDWFTTFWADNKTDVFFIPSLPVQNMSNLESFIFLLFVLANLEVGWSSRTWQSNLNFNNPHNWSPGRLPCPADRMVLRGSNPLALQLPEGQTTVSGMVLAGYVELVLPKDGAVQLTGVKHSANCDGQDAVFKHTQAQRWTDPDNWDGWNKATPDLERVPCTGEEVRFTPGTTFNVLTPPVLKLGSLEINGVMIDPFDWIDRYINVDSVRQLHKSDGDNPIITVDVTPCQPDTWCECGNGYLHSEVCKAACPLPLCKQPVKPSGFCCPICGAYFLLRSKDEASRRLTMVIDSFLKDKGIVWHASKVGPLIQIVVVEEGEYSGEIATIADDLKTSLEKNPAGWRVEQFYVSGHVWYPTSFTQVAGHFLSLLVFASLTIAAIIVFYSKNWSWLQFSSSGGRPFVFARFENQSGEVLVAHEQRQSSLPNPPQAFDNPMYGTTGKEQRNITVENPIYTELEDTPESCSAEEAVILNSLDFQKS